MAPTSEALTAERILEATEEVLRRHGPAKATVVDVALSLIQKAALREAVTKRWLDRTSEALAGIAAEAARGPEGRLRAWLLALFDAKRHKAGDDPELFATYTTLAAENSDAVDEHLADLTGQLAGIVRAGVESGDFSSADPVTTARAVFQATARFHDPGYHREWELPGVQDEFEAVVDLLTRGLRSA